MPFPPPANDCSSETVGAYKLKRWPLKPDSFDSVTSRRTRQKPLVDMWDIWIYVGRHSAVETPRCARARLKEREIDVRVPAAGFLSDQMEVWPALNLNNRESGQRRISFPQRFRESTWEWIITEIPLESWDFKETRNGAAIKWTAF